jgi:hypothetical protein
MFAPRKAIAFVLLTIGGMFSAAIDAVRPPENSAVSAAHRQIVAFDHKGEQLNMTSHKGEQLASTSHKGEQLAAIDDGAGHKGMA